MSNNCANLFLTGIFQVCGKLVSFKYICESLNALKLTCRYAPRIHEELNQELEVLKIAQDEYGCTIATDGWKDCANGKRLNSVSCTIEGVKFEKSTCATSQIQEAPLMVKELEEVIDIVGEDRTALVVADGAANMKAAMEKIERKYPKIFGVRCMAHLCQLLFKVCYFMYFLRLCLCLCLCLYLCHTFLLYVCYVFLRYKLPNIHPPNI